MRTCLLLFLLSILKTVQASDPYPRNPAIDIRHYSFHLELNDSTDRIAGEAGVDVRFKTPVAEFELDLTNTDATGKGMKVSEVLLENQPIKFLHQNNRLKIQLPAMAKGGEEKKFIIRYAGTPLEGLIISKNKFGDRTFFGDNWPDRARHWLPTIDHPYDKATCEFIVVAPDHYSIIATGEKVEESAIGKNRKLTHWKTSVILPVKVITMGAARFAIKYEGDVNQVPLQTWVFPQNRAEGFSDYAIAARPLDFFMKNIAPYPYEKLANVQSKTLYGALEDAGNIFYSENSVTGRGTVESLAAHEIAHQWFGNSASEADWHHVWLSEGFATYFANLYLENTYGSKRLAEEMETDRKQVIAYYQKNPFPIVNTSITDINKVLSTNTYQKASWVLHMLRREVGDEKFWQGIREYYRQFQLSNALTDDFRKVMETASGKDLKPFFDQWIFRPGHPSINVTWHYDAAHKQLKVVIEQKQGQLFDFPLEVAQVSGNGAIQVEKLKVSAQKQEFLIPAAQKPVTLTLDPQTWLLFEGVVLEGPSGKSVK